MGITQHVSGVDNVMALANLAMLTGNVGKCSTGVNPLRGQNNVQGACDMGGLPNVFPGYQKVDDPAVRGKFEKAWGVEGLPDKPGLPMTEMMKKAAEGSLKVLYIMGENPMLSDADTHHVEEALKNLDFLVVQDIFLTQTARLAHVVLPGACFAEKDGTFTNTERRVQRVRKAVEPPGESLADWEIFCRLSALLGYPMNYGHPSEIMDELRALTPSYGGMRYDRLEPWGLHWPCPTEDHPGTCILHGERFSKGLGTFMPRAFTPPDERCDDEYGFVLTTGRVYQQYHTGTMTRRDPILEREEPEPFIEVNPADARDLGIRDGWLVSVRSRRGELRLKARVTDRVPAKTVFIPFHFEEAAANMLTNPALDPVAKIPEYKVCAVALKGVS
jgi:predicted molibdopterin-dependent oxidoreductase YjgC